jgi:DinB superfamily
MSRENPYDTFLDGCPLETILAATHGVIASLLSTMTQEKWAASPAPGKWSPAEIICHLADCEIAFGFRLRQTLAENGPTLQPFDQEKWAATYSGVPATTALDAFTALRKWNLRLIGSAMPEAAGRPVFHPERGSMTFQTIVETMAGHDLNHLAQLRRLASE